MKEILFCTLAGSLLSCLLACNDPVAPPQESATQQQVQQQPSLTAFTDTLKTLSKGDTIAIERAVQLYDVLAPHDSTGADSAAAALWQFVNSVVAAHNDSLGKHSEMYGALLYPAQQTLTPEQKAIKTGFHSKRLKLVPDGEGGAYLVPRYETILPVLKSKTSQPVDHYLDLQAKEDTSPVFMDAGLAIELTELVERLIRTEALQGEKFPATFASEAAQRNRFYLRALMMGSDNSPSLAYEAITLNEPFRKAYEYLLSKYPSSEAAARINVWMTIVNTGDKRKIDDFRRTMY